MKLSLLPSWLQTGQGGADLGWQVSTSMFAHPTTNSLNIVGQSIGGFVFAANMFSFVLVVSLWADKARGRAGMCLRHARHASWHAQVPRLRLAPGPSAPLPIHSHLRPAAGGCGAGAGEGAAPGPENHGHAGLR